MFRAVARSALATSTTHAAATTLHAPRAAPVAIAHWAAAAAASSAVRAPMPRLLSAAAHSATATAAAAASSHRRTPLSSVTPYVEVLDSPPHLPTHLLLTCEHASEALPSPWHWGAHDGRLRGSHWASDPGAEDFTRELVEVVGSVAVLARFSRLLCDANRPLGADTMFRSTADGLPVGLNDPSRLTASERAHRESTLWAPYHRALHLAVQELQPSLVLSVHSFTPEYEGQKREVEVGVLYNSERDRDVADKFLAAFRAAGMRTELNAPWSAKDGFMYAADQFAQEGTHTIMFELRNDLCTDKQWRNKAIEITKQVLNELGHK